MVGEGNETVILIEPGGGLVLGLDHQGIGDDFAGEPLRAVAERIEMQGDTLRWLVSRNDQSRPYCLLGEIEIPDAQGPALAGQLDSMESYNPASYRGGVLRLHYARTQELQPWLDRVAVRGEVVVQFWLKPGEAAVTLELGKERQGEKIPAQFRRFLGGTGGDRRYTNTQWGSGAR